MTHSGGSRRGWGRALVPVAKRGISVISGGFPALVAVLDRPVVVFGVGGSRGEQGSDCDGGDGVGRAMHFSLLVSAFAS